MTIPGALVIPTVWLGLLGWELVEDLLTATPATTTATTTTATTTTATTSITTTTVGEVDLYGAPSVDLYGSPPVLAYNGWNPIRRFKRRTLDKSGNMKEGFIPRAYQADMKRINRRSFDSYLADQESLGREAKVERERYFHNLKSELGRRFGKDLHLITLEDMNEEELGYVTRLLQEDCLQFTGCVMASAR